MRLDARVDRNQAEIVKGLREVGATVLLLHRVGQGAPDLAVGFRNCTYLLEVKATGGRLTPDEADFLLAWNGHAVVVYSLDDALRAIGAIE